MRALCWGPTDADRALITGALTAELGAVLEHTVRSKTICLLAAYLHDTQVPELDRATTRFFDSTLRTNRYKTDAYRRAAVAVTAALRNAGVPVVVLGRLSVEHTLYRSTGARQFSDIDLLAAAEDIARAPAALRGQGYQPGRGSGTWTRRTGDPIAPLIVLDLATTLPHSGTGNVTELMARHTDISFPQHDRPLPVLAPPDALSHTLAQLGATTPPKAGRRWLLAADAIRHSRVTSPPSPHHAAVLAGWAALRSHWPLLPAAPTHLPTSKENR